MSTDDIQPAQMEEMTPHDSAKLPPPSTIYHEEDIHDKQATALVIVVLVMIAGIVLGMIIAGAVYYRSVLVVGQEHGEVNEGGAAFAARQAEAKLATTSGETKDADGNTVTHVPMDEAAQMLLDDPSILAGSAEDRTADNGSANIPTLPSYDDVLHPGGNAEGDNYNAEARRGTGSPQAESDTNADGADNAGDDTANEDSGDSAKHAADDSNAP